MNKYLIKYIVIEFLTKREYRLTRIILARNENEAIDNLKKLYGLNEVLILEVKEEN